MQDKKYDLVVAARSELGTLIKQIIVRDKEHCAQTQRTTAYINSNFVQPFTQPLTYLSQVFIAYRGRTDNFDQGQRERAQKKIDACSEEILADAYERNRQATRRDVKGTMEFLINWRNSPRQIVEPHATTLRILREVLTRYQSVMVLSGTANDFMGDLKTRERVIGYLKCRETVPN